MIGFQMTETMSGTHMFTAGNGPFGNFPMEFTIDWGPDNLIDWLNPLSGRFMTQSLNGTITIEGLCKHHPCEGELYLEYYKGKIRYEIRFVIANKPYIYIGEKTGMRPWNLHVTHTTCEGFLRDLETGEIISRSTTYFDLTKIISFISTFRLRR